MGLVEKLPGKEPLCIYKSNRFLLAHSCMTLGPSSFSKVNFFFKHATFLAVSLHFSLWYPNFRLKFHCRPKRLSFLISTLDIYWTPETLVCCLLQGYAFSSGSNDCLVLHILIDFTLTLLDKSHLGGSYLNEGNMFHWLYVFWWEKNWLFKKNYCCCLQLAKTNAAISSLTQYFQCHKIQKYKINKCN